MTETMQYMLQRRPDMGLFKKKKKKNLIVNCVWCFSESINIIPIVPHQSLLEFYLKKFFCFKESIFLVMNNPF